MVNETKTKVTALLLAMAFLFVWLAAATSADSLVYKQGQEVDLKIPCYVNGSYCSAGATCDITIQYPNGTLLVSNQAMDYNPSYFNYTLYPAQTTAIGNYPCSMVCVDGGESGYKDFTFEITTTGAGNELMINIIAFILIIIAILIFMIGLNRQDWIITMLSSFMFGIAGFNFYFFPLVYLPSLVNKVLAWVLWGIGSYILLRTSIEVAGGALGND
jgi:hypothetical protein